MSIIHGGSHAAIRFMRKAPATLAVYWLYVAHANDDGVAWPSLPALEKESGWSENACHEGRRWLVEHDALEEVPDYVRPQWRDLTGKALSVRKNLDKAEYYRPTGRLTINGKTYPMLYEKTVVDTAQDEVSNEITDTLPDEVSAVVDAAPHEVSNAPAALCDASRDEVSTDPSIPHANRYRTPTDIGPGEDELDSSSTELDSNTTELGLKKSSSLEPLPANEERPNIFALYENAFGPLTPMMAETLKAAAEEWPADWVAGAFQEAVDHNGRSWAYVRTILETCQAEGRPPGKPPAGVAPTSTNGRGRSAVAPSTSTPGDDLVSRLTAEEFSQLGEVPPPDYLAGRPDHDRFESWKLAGRKGTARRRAEARLATQGA